MNSLHICEDGDRISINLPFDLPINQIDDTIGQFTESLKEKKEVKITITAENGDEDSLINSANILYKILVKLKNYIGVTTLEIEKSIINQECFREISNLKNLCSLSFKDSSFYTCDDYEPFITLTELRKLDLSNTNIFEEDFSDLQLKGAFETKFMKFMKAIRTLTKLEELNLYYNRLMPQMAKKNSKKLAAQNEEYNAWAERIIDMSAHCLVYSFKGDYLNLSGCGLGPVFLNFYRTYQNQAGEQPNIVDLTKNDIKVYEAADFLLGIENPPSKILFDEPEEIKWQLGSLLLQDKNISIN